jgi:histidine ammonia-lyase/phenylalanine ammonia-lyase
MTAIAALAWNKINRLACISDFLTAATVEILNGNDIPFRSKVSEIKNHSGQIESAEYIFNIIKDSNRVNTYEHLIDRIGAIDNEDYKKHDIKIQDRYSLRCAPQINGVLRDTLNFTKTWIESEANSANDNPLIDYKDEIIYNGGNFYGGHIAGACDFLRISLANSADLSDKQAALIIDGKFNKLTENLIPHLKEDSPEQGLHYGFKAAQISIAALSSEIQFLSSPVSIHSRPTESLNQDKVSLGTISSRKLAEAVDLTFLQFSIHLLAVLQAIDLIGLKDFGSFTKKIYSEVRKLSSFVDQDRPLDSDVEKVSEFLKHTTIFINNR